jgi:inner membrane protein
MIASIAQGWGGAQTLEGPWIVIPYATREEETVEENGKSVTRMRDVTRQLVIKASDARLDTRLTPERRKRSIYEAIVYTGKNQGSSRFQLPTDLLSRGIPQGALKLAQAEIRFGLSDVQGLQSDTVTATLGGQSLKLLPGRDIGMNGFYAKFDATALLSQPLALDYGYGFRGNGALALRPEGDFVKWTVRAPWASPSFKGFLPQERKVGAKDFEATWRIGGLSLGGDTNAQPAVATISRSSSYSPPAAGLEARVELFEPVDIYAQVDRATKYGFLFVGFTFVALLMFDVIGGRKVSLVEYMLTGAGLVMFFVLLLALAEVIGFGGAYALASGAIIGLISAYSAAVLKSWGRGSGMGGLLAGLYATLYVLLSLEAYSLLIGALLLFAALAGIMYLTRNIDWGAKRASDAEVMA